MGFKQNGLKIYPKPKGFWQEDVFMRASSGLLISANELVGPYSFTNPGQIDDMSYGMFEATVSGSRWCYSQDTNISNRNLHKFHFLVGHLNIGGTKVTRLADLVSSVLKDSVEIESSRLPAAFLVVSASLGKAVLLLENQGVAEKIGKELDCIIVDSAENVSTENVNTKSSFFSNLEPSHTSITWKSPTNYWFEELPFFGQLECDIRCPKCGGEDSWFPKDEHPPESCRSCGYSK